MSSSSGPTDNIQDPNRPPDLTPPKKQSLSPEQQQARDASFGVQNAGGLEGRSRAQIENDIYHGLLNQKILDEQARALSEEEKRRAREEKLAQIKAERDAALGAPPGRRQIALASRSLNQAGSESFLVGAG